MMDAQNGWVVSFSMKCLYFNIQFVLEIQTLFAPLTPCSKLPTYLPFKEFYLGQDNHDNRREKGSEREDGCKHSAGPHLAPERDRQTRFPAQPGDIFVRYRTVTGVPRDCRRVVAPVVILW